MTRYQTDILKVGQWRADPENFDDLASGDLPIILTPSESYLLRAADFKTYLERCKFERDRAGLKVDDPNHCPLLVANKNLVDAQHELVEQLQPITGLDVNQLLCSGMENYEKYIDLSIKLLAPFVGDSKAILSDVMGTSATRS